MTRSIRCLALCVVAVTGLMLAIPAAVLAQGGDGFLFKQPRVTFKFTTGYDFQRARSDIHDFAIDSLTLGRRDFDSPYVGGEIGVRVSERWDVAVSVGIRTSSADSEFRYYVDQDDLPIEQVTKLRQIPVTVSGKFYLRDRGRAIGRFAWIPTMITPFVGAGVGMVEYRYEQVGDFIDFDTFDIYYDRYVTKGRTVLGTALTGVDLAVGRQFLFTAEARYGWANGTLDESSGFDRMDLNGLQLLAGLAIRF